MTSLIATLALLGPALLFVAALVGLNAPLANPKRMLIVGRLATLSALALALCAVVLTVVAGSTTSPLLGMNGVGLSVRLDAVSCSMFVLVAFVGVIVVQYSRNYLDGDARQASFVGGLCLTLAAVMGLVLAGNLVQLVAAWIATSLTLHRLLIFYRERAAARLAARKKFITARLGDVCLIGASILLVSAFGSTDIATLLERASALVPGTVPTAVSGAALLLGIAALLKSAQFPSHGWLPEVMETPTPVSALLHAGIINAGGFLVIRFADVMLLSAPSLHLIAIIGGFTALFGGVVMLTQTSIKASLAWSTVAQMGYMMLQCGLGAFSIALLHLVAHSLYKAHAFLSSGSAVELAKMPAGANAPQRPRLLPVLASLLLALGMYALLGALFGEFFHAVPAVLTLGAILVMGVSLLLAPSMQGLRNGRLVGRTLLAAAGATLAYFTLQAGATWVTASSLPPIPAPTLVGLGIMVLAVISFALVTVLQSLAPRWTHRPAWRAARVHLANGFYVNAWFNRLVGASRSSAVAAPLPTRTP